MLLKLLKNMVIILALMIMSWIILKIKCCPSPVYKEERVQKGTLHIVIGQDVLAKNSHHHIVRKIQTNALMQLLNTGLLISADMEVAEERSPNMTDSSEGEVEQILYGADC